MQLHLSMRCQRLLEGLADFCYPGTCAVCGEQAESRWPVCERCSGFLQAIEQEGACRCCGMPLPQWEAPCAYCLGKGRGRIKRVLRLGRYVEPLRELIHAMKYHRRWPIAEYLADRLLADVAVQGLLAESDVLVPVPLHWRRQIQRGYNQAGVLAERLAKQTGRKIVWAAKRRRDTPTQTAMRSMEARRTNLRGAFKLVRPRAVAGKRVVLVDDVMTSGATLKALSRAIWRGRPASLSAIVVAVADPRGRGFEGI